MSKKYTADILDSTIENGYGRINLGQWGVGIGSATNPRAGIETDSDAILKNGVWINNNSSVYFADTVNNYGTSYAYIWGNGNAGTSFLAFDTNAGRAMTIDNNRNVGIGTTSPSRKLDVVGGFFRTSDAASGKESAFVQGGTGYAYFGNLGSGPAAFGNSENYTTLIANGGNIAIGTTSLSGTNRLEIESINPYDLSTGGNDTGGILIRGAVSTGNGSYTGGIGFGFGTGTVGLAGVQESADSDFLGMAFFTHPTGTGNAASEEKMRLSAAGYLMIAQTSNVTGQRLQVNGNIDAVYNSSNYARTGRGTTGGYFQAYASGVEKIMIRSYGDSFLNGGNVGIGTTSPNYRLDITTTSTEGAQIALRNTSTGDAGIYFDASNGDLIGSDYWWIGQRNNLDFAISGSGSAGNLNFDVGGSERMRITSSGNVGIGTTSPADKLEVVGNIRLRQSLSNAETVYISTNSRGGGTNDADMRFGNSNSGDIMTIHNDLVGIGTTSPSAKLEVAGDFKYAYPHLERVYYDSFANTPGNRTYKISLVSLGGSGQSAFYYFTVLGYRAFGSMNSHFEYKVHIHRRRSGTSDLINAQVYKMSSEVDGLQFFIYNEGSGSNGLYNMYVYMPSSYSGLFVYDTPQNDSLNYTTKNLWSIYGSDLGVPTFGSEVIAKKLIWT